jgi:prepilin-type N-terminal cleavage/methylation domain-containing protein
VARRSGRDVETKRMKHVRRQSRGFTLIEVMFASLLMGIVGVAIVSFLGAFASGGAARRNASDAALEAALATQRFNSFVPRFRSVLEIADDSALIWRSDRVPSRTVHASEVGLVWFDADQGELVLEIINTNALAANRTLEREYESTQYDDLAEDLAELRAEGLLVRSILAEGIEAIEVTPDPMQAGAVRLQFSVGGTDASATFAPATLEEPFE